jgi:hypothetical protein
MEYAKSSKINEKQIGLVKGFSKLVGNAVLQAFPHMPSNIFSYARYEVSVRGSSKIITVHFSYYRRVSSIQITLSEDRNKPSTILADNQVSYLNMPTKQLLDIAKDLFKGFWSETLNSSAKFVALNFSCDATYLESYYQKEGVSSNGSTEYYNFTERFSI